MSVCRDIHLYRVSADRTSVRLPAGSHGSHHEHHSIPGAIHRLDSGSYNRVDSLPDKSAVGLCRRVGGTASGIEHHFTERLGENVGYASADDSVSAVGCRQNIRRSGNDIGDTHVCSRENHRSIRPSLRQKQKEKSVIQRIIKINVDSKGY